MPRSPRRQYLIRDVESGKMLGNELGYTARGALVRFATTRPEVAGKVVDVKVRAEPGELLPDDDWERFSVD